MLEIVHDLAPGAELLFASGIESPLAFIQAVECLTAAGANVIVDDLGFFGEPYFEDGPIAQAVRSAVAAGVSYHTAAGNSARSPLAGALPAGPWEPGRPRARQLRHRRRHGHGERRGGLARRLAAVRAPVGRSVRQRQRRLRPARRRPRGPGAPGRQRRDPPARQRRSHRGRDPPGRASADWPSSGSVALRGCSSCSACATSWQWNT